MKRLARAIYYRKLLLHGASRVFNFVNCCNKGPLVVPGKTLYICKEVWSRNQFDGYVIYVGKRHVLLKECKGEAL